MTYIFDGKVFAAAKEEEIKTAVNRLKSRGVVPALVSILVGDDPGSKLYVGLKQKAAQRVGAELRVIDLSVSQGAKKIVATIKQYNEDPNIHGIMIQLPLPIGLRAFQDEIIAAIDPAKDVDGMREDSTFITPVVGAVLQILDEAQKSALSKVTPCKVVVVGNKGFVGQRLVRVLRETKKDWEMVGVDIGTKNPEQITKNADVLIAATGQPNLITADMVKTGAILIDVGAPAGDIQKGAYDKAAFVSPVPGGVGPVTISCLLENLVASVGKMG